LNEKGDVGIAQALRRRVQLRLQSVVPARVCDQAGAGVELPRILERSQSLDQPLLERRSGPVEARVELVKEERQVKVGPIALGDQEPVERAILVLGLQPAGKPAPGPD